MKKTLMIWLVPLVFIMTLVSMAAAVDPAAAPAVEAAKTWLALVDAGQFGKTWDMAAEIFKSAASRRQWEATLELLRKNLGAVVERKLATAVHATSLPGAPDGEYYVIEYKTTYQNKKEAVERIVPMKEKDGQWRISGYFIR